MVQGVRVGALALGALLVGCASLAEGPEGPAPGAVTFGDAPPPSLPVGDGGQKPRVDGGFPTDGGVLPAARFAQRVVSVTPGDCAGFGLASMPDVVLGPPEGSGDTQGSLDVLSLGKGGAIVLSFEENPIVDGPGADFVVFENAFFAGGDPSRPFVELATVSVSEDGVSFVEFPCTKSASEPPPYGACAGWRPVRSSSANGVSPFDSRDGRRRSVRPRRPRAPARAVRPHRRPRGGHLRLEPHGQAHHGRFRPRRGGLDPRRKEVTFRHVALGVRSGVHERWHFRWEFFLPPPSIGT
jgi:hypothetical protein